MTSTNPRAHRFRKVASQSILVPPPLPLINLPEESRLAQTGLPEERPTNLPIRRHIPNSVAIAALKAKADGRTVEFDGLQPPKPEPILRESRTLLDAEADEYEELNVLARIHVYEYNQPDVFGNSNAPNDTLVFDSLFESGNLLRAERIFRKAPTIGSKSRMPQHEYELLIHPDVKNGAYRQWFYFEVRNGKPGVTYRFALINLAKSGALFGQGLQPVVYSEQDAATKGFGWRHKGTHVRYDVAVSPVAPLGANALSFQYEFEHKNDCVYFACIQPYTYTDLMDYFEHLENDPQRSLTFRRTEMCQSLAGNACDLLSITSPGKDGIPQGERRIIVVSARVHPGEPNSSWMMQGMLDYLTGSSSGATVLRRNFIFKVVPMLNPDGVINGNTRVSLAGWDLNRKWSNPIEQLFPTIYHLKQQLAHFQSHGRVAIYCDLHGHSINRNIFTYGCYTSKKKSSSSDGTKSSTDPGNTATSTNTNTNIGVKADPRVFPMIVARHSPSFSFANCDFTVHKSKVTAARVVVNQELGVINSYTLEASFCGPDFGVRKDTQFSTWDLEEMGRCWCQSLIIYYGLTAQVKALDAERSRSATLDHHKQSDVELPSPTSHRDAQVKFNPAEVEDEESRLARDLLLDCEAAISALFAHSGLDTNDREVLEDGHDVGALDSDLSGADEEPIAPSPELGSQQNTPRSNKQEKQSDDTVEADADGEGYTSAPEESQATGKNSSSSGQNTRKKNSRRKQSRATKPKPVISQLSKKGDKPKKKKKRKSKPELQRTNSISAAPSIGPKPEDTATISPRFVTVSISSTSTPESASKPPVNRAIGARRTTVKNTRPKSSSEVPRSVSSAILQATMRNGMASPRSSRRPRPIPTYLNAPKDTLLVLPLVHGGSSRGIVPRMLKTAPGYAPERPAVEDSPNVNFTRMGTGLPALLTGRDEDQRRHSLVRQKSRRQENDDIDDSDICPAGSEPELYASTKILDIM